MEQTLSQPKQTNLGRNLFMAIGAFLLIGLLTIMGIGLMNVESSDLQGRAAPNFTLPLFDQFEEEEITLADLRGQVVVINFWASWCVECYKEADLLEQAWRDYKDQGVVFIGVDHLDTEKEALAYMAQYNITYPSGQDIGDKISDDYAITGVPETFFIDKDGNIAHVTIGPVEKTELYNLLDSLVAQPAQGT